MIKLNTPVNKLNQFLRQLLKVAGFVSGAYLVTLFVVESFGGVNPLVEYSSSGFSRIESAATKNKTGLGVAYQACKNDLANSVDSFEFPDDSYQAWNLSGGRFLIESRIFTSTETGSPVAANFLCRVLKTEENEDFVVHWKVQDIQIGTL